MLNYFISNVFIIIIIFYLFFNFFLSNTINLQQGLPNLLKSFITL